MYVWFYLLLVVFVTWTEAGSSVSLLTAEDGLDFEGSLNWQGLFLPEFAEFQKHVGKQNQKLKKNRRRIMAIVSQFYLADVTSAKTAYQASMDDVNEAVASIHSEADLEKAQMAVKKCKEQLMEYMTAQLRFIESFRERTK